LETQDPNDLETQNPEDLETQDNSETDQLPTLPSFSNKIGNSKGEI
jgi:hypothetical protein